MEAVQPGTVANTSWAKWVGDCEYDNEREDGIKSSKMAEQGDVSTARNVAALIQPMGKSKRQAQKVLVMINGKETRRNEGIKNK